MRNEKWVCRPNKALHLKEKRGKIIVYDFDFGGKNPNLREEVFIDSKPLLELFWVDSMVDFLYGMNWRSYIEEKWARMAKSAIFWTKPSSGIDTKEWYRYPLCRGGVVPVPIGSVGLVPVPVKVVLVPLLPTTLFLHIFAPLSSYSYTDCLGTLIND